MKVKSVLPCNAGANLRCSPDFFVDEKIEKGQEAERYDVHEDKIQPSHVDLKGGTDYDAIILYWVRSSYNKIKL